MSLKNIAGSQLPVTSNPPELDTDNRLTVSGIKLRDGRTVGAQAVIITTGTFLNGLIHCGEQQYPAGRSGEPAAVLLGESLKALGLRGCRLKTGTPPRLDGRSIDWSKFAVQPGDEDPDALQLPYQKGRASRQAGARVTSPSRPPRRIASCAKT